MSPRTWALQVLASALIWALIFGLIIGERGFTLIIFVAV